MSNGRAARVHGPAIIVLALGLAISAALFVAARNVRDRDEDRLLRQRVLAASSILVSAIPGTQTPLVAAAEQAEETAGRADAFTRIMSAHVGAGKRFVGASLWRPGSTVPMSVMGVAPALTSRPPEQIKSFIEDAGAHDGLAVVNLLDYSEPRVGYAAASSRPGVSFVVYAETALPANRTSVVQPDSAFADLNYAVYLGKGERDSNLLLASTARVPLRGRRSSIDTAFGNTSLRLVLSPRKALGGSWSPHAPSLMAAGGILLTLGGTGLTERVLRSRERARRLSDENAALYAAQRSVAQALQQSMLPGVLPDLSGAEFSVRYIAGTAELEVGGDWYDVVEVGEDRALFAVGDVSGRGLEAAIVMASLRYSIRAYASDGDGPATILSKLGGLLDVAEDGRFATVLCGLFDARTGEVTMANAGHPCPVLVDGRRCTTVDAPAGVPVGVRSEAQYETVTVPLPAEVTLLVFTDGLVERRGETLDAGLDRLCASADGGLPLDEMLGRLLADLTPDGSEDDVAILGLRWGGRDEEWAQPGARSGDTDPTKDQNTAPMV